jgi:predicted metal-dependent phosphoesterase TrpH
MAVKQKGNKEVIQNLNAFIKKQRSLSQAGISSALLFIESRAIAKTPVDTGNLRNSFYRKNLITDKNKPAGEIGNLAEYAIYVHEMVDNYHRVGEAKYLQNAIAENTNKIKDIIVSRLRV